MKERLKITIEQIDLPSAGKMVWEVTGDEASSILKWGESVLILLGILPNVTAQIKNRMKRE